MTRGRSDIAGTGQKQEMLTTRQRQFAQEYVKCKDAKQAAMLTGTPERSAAAMGSQYLNADRYPLVVQYVNKLKQAIEEKCILDAVGIRTYLHTAMQVSLVDYFLPGDDGGWLISLEDFRNLPQHVKMLVESCEMHTTKTVMKDGAQQVVSMLWVKMVSKTVAMTTAAKYGLVEKHQVETKEQIDLAGVLGSLPQGDVPDEVERRLENLLEYRAEVKDGEQLGMGLSGEDSGVAETEDQPEPEAAEPGQESADQEPEDNAGEDASR